MLEQVFFFFFLGGGGGGLWEEGISDAFDEGLVLRVYRV